MLISFIFLLLGILLLYFGAEWLVRGSSGLALNLGVSPVVVGLTVVAFGTSAPELVASLHAQLAFGAGNIALGNAIGSNIWNIGLVLGLSAILTPLEVASPIVRREAPFAIWVTVLLLLMMMGGTLNRWEGGLLFASLIAYVAFQIRIARLGKKADKLVTSLTKELAPAKTKKPWYLLLLISVGIALLLSGARLLIDNAIFLAKAFGLSQRVIGLTLVAFGTSLPELATSLVAALKKERDIAVANVIGSNIFNILGIIGLAAFIRPIAFERALLTFDGPFMLGILLLMMLLIIRKKKLGRWGGAALVGVCLFYVYCLFRWGNPI